jgi:PII-like signaling protein
LIEDCRKLTTYFGERDRCGERFVADALVDAYARHGFQTSVILRGIEGFGAKQHLHTDRQLTLSEDLPLISVAVDTRQRIQAALDEIAAISSGGLITLERARMITGHVGDIELPDELHEATKLTVYVGRVERVGLRAAHVAVVDLLKRHGLDGATVLLGIDGTAHGVRQRARFFGANARVPLMIICVGDGQRVARALPELGAMLQRPLITLERVRVCKRGGVRLAEPRHLPQTDPSGLGIWQKLMVYHGEQARHRGRPLHHALIRGLREAGAFGATSVRGIWGFHGDHAPDGDSFWQLRRRVPVTTVIVDTPPRIRRSFELIDELTDETGLVTSEMVPAFRATGPGLDHGGLELASH